MAARYPFPTATHTYFSSLNKHSQKRKFLAGSITEPYFQYKFGLSEEILAERMSIVDNCSLAHKNLQLVWTSCKLQSDIAQLDAFRAANEAIYTAPTIELASSILWHIFRNVFDADTVLWDEALALLNVRSLEHAVNGPSPKLFNTYRKYLEQYTTLPKVGDSVQAALQDQLELTGLSNVGWRVRILKGSEHAHTYHSAKTISIGEEYAPRLPSAVKRIAVHEVVGHAVRGPQSTIEESEGFAIVLEQLTKEQFSYRRSYRYLAVALGWGVFGTPLTFSQVHEVLWRLMKIHTKYSESDAKAYAFDECYRAFRGGRSDVPGAVFLKDAVYFSANINMWKVLTNQELSYNEFVDIIEGRRTILS
jgi:hypothetical protein